MRWIRCHYFKLLILCMCSICFKLCLLYSKVELIGTVCLESSSIKQFTHPEIWKRHAQQLHSTRKV